MSHPWLTYVNLPVDDFRSHEIINLEIEFVTRVTYGTTYSIINILMTSLRILKVFSPYNPSGNFKLILAVKVYKNKPRNRTNRILNYILNSYLNQI